MESSLAEPPRAPARTTIALLLWLLLGLTATGVWALAGGGVYWPNWVWIGAGGLVGALLVVRVAWGQGGARVRWAVAHAGLGAVAAAVVVGVWMLAGRGPWLGWTLLGIGLAVALHLVLAFAERFPPQPIEHRLSERVDELTRTRSGVLDVQAAELRRIERDLHDGAQSRLVALNVLLGRAELELERAPAAGALIHQARGEATAAIAELRDLARGMAPPLLADRGLEAAVEALTLRSPISVALDCSMNQRASRPTEAAAYFVVAEALTNVIKHAPGAAAQVSIAAGDGMLEVVVVDDGDGGADPLGSGLTGLRQRVEALDGRLAITSKPGDGTRITAELPCGS